MPIAGKNRVAAQETFLQLFPYRLNSAIKLADSGTWRTVSQFHCLSNQEILDVLANGSRKLRAFSFDDTTRFAVIVVPEGSPYSQSHECAKLLQHIEDLGVSVAVYKAADSENIHLYMFFAQEVSSAAAARVLTKLLNQGGYYEGSQSLQIHPTREQLPFPLQKGFAWLNKNLEVIVRRDELSFDQAVDRFLNDMSTHICQFEQLVTLSEHTDRIPSSDMLLSAVPSIPDTAQVSEKIQAAWQTLSRRFEEEIPKDAPVFRVDTCTVKSEYSDQSPDQSVHPQQVAQDCLSHEIAADFDELFTQHKQTDPIPEFPSGGFLNQPDQSLEFQRLVPDSKHRTAPSQHASRQLQLFGVRLRPTNSTSSSLRKQKIPTSDFPLERAPPKTG